MLPDGSAVFGRRFEPVVRYHYPREDWPESREMRSGEPGLYLVSREGKIQRVAAGPPADSLPGDNVLGIVFAQARNHWVCTNYGVAALGEDDSLLAHFTRADGLCANRLVGGVAYGDRVYFATGWGDHGGGLAVYDHATAVFTALFQSDGLATDKLAGIAPGGGKLTLQYDVEYMRHGRGVYRLHPPGQLDLESGIIESGGEPRLMSQTEVHEIMYARRDFQQRRPMPCLGGVVLSEQEHGGKTYLCGTRGLVVLPPRTGARPLNLRSLRPEIIFDPSIAQIAEAGKVRIVRPISLDRLKKLLEDENPYVRIKALAASKERVDGGRAHYAPVIPVIEQRIADPHPAVRTTAIMLLSLTEDKMVIEPLRKILDDPSPYLRAVAALALVRHGEMPPLEHIEEVLSYCDRFDSLPCSRECSITNHREELGESLSFVRQYISRDPVYRILAPHADTPMFRLFMKHPLPADTYQPRQEILAMLGASLTKHPDAAPLLLSAYQADRGAWGQVRFAQAVFKYAGRDMLPVLHKALASDDRVVRSNAARACGAIADASSIPHLIEALDLESGLSRASIVWALGELKAKDALPELVTLYIDARNDEQRRRGSGYRMAQAQAEITAQYDAIASLDSIASDWNELEASLEPEPVDPRENEELLSPEIVLEAVRKIGPEASQEFYRTLAAEEDAQARQEAAVNLAEAGDDEAQKNLPVLRNLLADDDVQVRMRAAVSLFILGEESAQRPILEWLGSPKDWEKGQILNQLARVKPASRLSFAREQIEAMSRDTSAWRECRDSARNLLGEMDKK